MQHWSFKYIGCAYFWLKFKQTQTQKIHKFKKNEQLHDSIKCVELHSFYVRRTCAMHIGLLLHFIISAVEASPCLHICQALSIQVDSALLDIYINKFGNIHD